MEDQSLDFHAQASRINKTHAELGGSREQRAGKRLGEVEHRKLKKGEPVVGGACSSGCGAAIWLSAILGTLSKAPVMGELVSPVMRQPQRHRLCGGDIVFV